ncbi:MAG TPA: hypothetical protein PLJ10_13290 [Candidatus Hydrogenedens sp.]|nr:hypothetical protein [Candidatus Hydrogenedens sp.]
MLPIHVNLGKKLTTEDTEMRGGNDKNRLCGSLWLDFLCRM